MNYNMKTKIKRLVSLLAVFIACVGFNQVKAQGGHESCAPNCEYWKITGKTRPKGSVSCIDRTCPICAKKQKEEKDKKEKMTQQKIDAWKAGEKTRQASVKQKQQDAVQAKEKYVKEKKENEVVLVAPTPKVEKSTIITLSAEDEKILELSQNINLNITYYSGKVYWADEFVDFPIPVGRIWYDDHDKFDRKTYKHYYAILKDNLNVKSKIPYTGYSGESYPSRLEFNYKEEYKKTEEYRNRFHIFFGFQDTGLFIVEFKNEPTQKKWMDLVDVQGNCVFNNADIERIIYNKVNKTYLIKKLGESTSTEEYNPTTNKITPIQ